MTPHFSPDLRAALLGTPVSTPALLAAGEELTLVLRVEKLAPFRKPLPLLVKVFAWQPEGGAWVVAVAFRVTGNPRAPLEGDAYLNPLAGRLGQSGAAEQAIPLRLFLLQPDPNRGSGQGR